MQLCVKSFNHAIEQSHLWLRALAEIGSFASEEDAYSALSAVLHALRDRLIANEAVHLAAQLPMLIRGMYYEGWRPASVPNKMNTAAELIDHVNTHLRNAKNRIDAKAAISAVFKLLNEKISAGEIKNIKSELPHQILALWP